MAGVPVPGFEPMPEAISEDGRPDVRSSPGGKEEIARDGIKVSLHEPTGTAAEEIFESGRRTECRSIVMGDARARCMYNLLVGSATKGVLKHSTPACPPSSGSSETCSRGTAKHCS